MLDSRGTRGAECDFGAPGKWICSPNTGCRGAGVFLRSDGEDGFGAAKVATRLSLLFYKATIKPSHPRGPGGIAESEDGAADGHVGVVGEFTVVHRFATGHGSAERFGVRVTMTCGTAVPA